MSKLLEELGITPCPWSVAGFKNERFISGVIEGGRMTYGSWFNGADDSDANLIAASPEMLEALIDYCMMMEGDLKSAEVNVKQMRSLLELFEKYISIIEKATRKSWQEVKGIYERIQH